MRAVSCYHDECQLTPTHEVRALRAVLPYGEATLTCLDHLPELLRDLGAAEVAPLAPAPAREAG